MQLHLSLISLHLMKVDPSGIGLFLRPNGRREVYFFVSKMVIFISIMNKFNISKD